MKNGFLLFTVLMIFSNVSFSQILSDQLIVKYRTTPTLKSLTTNTSFSSTQFNNALSFASAMTGVKLNIKRKLHDGSLVIKTDQRKTNEELETIASVLLQDFNVESAQPDHLFFAAFNPDDTSYRGGWQWSLANQKYALNMPEAWDLATGANVNVAVIDTGYLPHPDLMENILPGYDMISNSVFSNDGDGRDNDALDSGTYSIVDECGPGEPAVNSTWHGMKMAGIIAAVTNNKTKLGNKSALASIAYNAKIVPVRVIGKCGAFESDLADAIRWAAGLDVPDNNNPGKNIDRNTNVAQVINLSLGSGIPKAGDTKTCPAFIQSAITAAYNKNITLVAAAGNDGGTSNDSIHYADLSYPSNCLNVISVTGTSENGRRWQKSNHGYVVDVAAPAGDLIVLNNNGTDIPGTIYGTKTKKQAGTSISAAHVSGIAALIYSVNSKVTPSQVEKILRDSVDKANPFSPTRFGLFDDYCILFNFCGEGIVNAKNSLNSPFLTIPTISKTPPSTLPDSAKTKNGKTIKLTPLSNDASANGEPLTALLVTPASHGNVTLNSDKTSFTYTHDGSSTTTDSFTYKATNGIAASAPVTVSITIEPVAGGGTGGTTTPTIKYSLPVPIMEAIKIYQQK